MSKCSNCGYESKPAALFFDRLGQPVYGLDTVLLYVRPTVSKSKDGMSVTVEIQTEILIPIEGERDTKRNSFSYQCIRYHGNTGEKFSGQIGDKLSNVINLNRNVESLQRAGVL